MQKKKNVFFHVMYKSGCSSDICSSFRCRAMPVMPKARALKKLILTSELMDIIKIINKKNKSFQCNSLIDKFNPFKGKSVDIKFKLTNQRSGLIIAIDCNNY